MCMPKYNHAHMLHVHVHVLVHIHMCTWHLYRCWLLHTIHYIVQLAVVR